MSKQQCSKKKVEKAFKYAVCEIMCGKPLKKLEKCIKEEGGCNSYKVFNKIIES